jgi:hypothetical protein
MIIDNKPPYRNRGIPPTPYGQLASARVFLSYAREDLPVVLRFYEHFGFHKVQAWLDVYNLLPGQAWQPTITAALKASSHCVIFLTERSITKRGTFQREINEALDVSLSLPHGSIFLIPVLLDESIITDERLQRLEWVTLYPTYSQCFYKILVAVAGGGPYPPPPPPPLGDQQAWYRVLRDSLWHASQHGLDPVNTYYIEFFLAYPGIKVPRRVREAGGPTATLLLKHKGFARLSVGDHKFSVTSATTQHELFDIPYGAVKSFVHPWMDRVISFVPEPDYLPNKEVPLG